MSDSSTEDNDWPLLPQLLIFLLFVLSPDDHSRVRLLVLDGDPHSDYINANYIDVSILIGLSSYGLELTVQTRDLIERLSLTCPSESSRNIQSCVPFP